MTNTMNHEYGWYNAEPRIQTHVPELLAASIDDFPPHSYKYADVDVVYRYTSELVRRIIDSTPITGRYARILVDVKVQNLHSRICSCIPGWHLDGSRQQKEIHHLCVLHGPQTEFVDEPLYLSTAYPQNVKSIPQDIAVRPLTEGTITTYSSLDFHRGVYASAPTRRLLVRLTETDHIKPCNSIYTPRSEYGYTATSY